MMIVISKIFQLYLFVVSKIESCLLPVADLVIRIWLADVFWKSGLTKIASWDSTLGLFNYVYSVPLLPPNLAAVLATSVELGGASLLALGLAGRFGTAALFILNLVAVISYPDLSAAGLQDHYYWGLLLLIFFIRGPGKLSLDYWIRSRIITGHRTKPAAPASA